MIAIAKGMEWHPMLPEIVGGDIETRYVAITTADGGYKCITKDASWVIANKGAYTAILDFYETHVNSDIKRHVTNGYSVVLDFLSLRIFLVREWKVIIFSTKNTMLATNMGVKSRVKGEASKLFALYWLKNTLKGHVDIFEPDFNNDETSTAVVSQSQNVFYLDEWRERKNAIS